MYGDLFMFLKNIYQKDIGLLFPAAEQTLFLEVWKWPDEFTENLRVDGLNVKVDFLSKMYSINPSLFWLPIIACVIRKEPLHDDYWEIAKHLRITTADAEAWVDFTYRWVFPVGFSHNSVKPILLKFVKTLEDKFGEPLRFKYKVFSNLTHPWSGSYR